MKSPFPGMDPYIEACGLWEDFHLHLIQRIGDYLARSVPDRYLVRTGERHYVVLVGPEGKEQHPILPDVSITAGTEPRRGGKKGGTALAEPVAEFAPITMRAFVPEEHREAFVEIYEATPHQRLITAIEVLSPPNKRSGTEGWDLYQRKRQSLFLSEASFVELDLLRGGERMPMASPWPHSPYALLVHRASLTLTCKVWPAHFRDPLPALPIPLAKPDADIVLKLQPLVDEIYQLYKYERSIDYTKPVSPALDAEDAAWLEERLRRRQSKPKRK